MNSSNFYLDLLKDFSHNPTVMQDRALNLISNFLINQNYNELFLLKGFAGTGKTSIVGTLVKNSWKIKKNLILLAPTGRAAKVIGNYAGKEAFTIHKKIYYPKSKSGGGISFSLQKNKHKNTVFIVDESSMIPDANPDSMLFETGSLLSDLIQYVYSGHRCQLILIGDTAQLPPIKLDISPYAVEYLSKKGFDPQYGARPIKRLVQKEILNQGSKEMLKGNIQNGDVILIDSFNDEIVFRTNNKKESKLKIDEKVNI